MRFEQKWMGKNCRDGSVFPASVPGNIQADYALFHNFPDVQLSDNCKRFAELENDTWEYYTKPEFRRENGERVYFVSKGIIYDYEIFLNDELIYSYEGMFNNVDIDITDKIKDESILLIRIKPLPKSKRGASGTRDEANEACIPPVCYGWDWNPRLLVSGLWQDAYIETRDEYYIGNAEVLASLNASLDEGTVNCSFECQVPCEISVFNDRGSLVARTSGKKLSIKDPCLWWCNGQGVPYLYKYVISNERCSVQGEIGFKQIRLVRNCGADEGDAFPKGPYASPITIELNGRRIFAKGSNWVNPELFWADANKERYEELIKLARDCNMNILRIWGGSGMCKDVFYKLCDKYGIMVWQEFMLSCNQYIDIEPYMSVLKDEATAIIKKLRSHPSHVIWCGGNELFNSWSGMDDQSLPLRLLNSLCFELDREKPFLPTSPVNGMAHGGYMFYDDKQGGEVFGAFINARNTAYTEFGVPSFACVEDLEKIIPSDELFPPRRTASWVIHHAFDAWGPEPWACLPTIEKYFGSVKDIYELVECSQWLQNEGYRAAFEEVRRQWPHASMAINWCFNEPWITAAGNSLITYPNKPKPCYEYVKKALRAVLFSARIEKFSWSAGEEFSAEIWLLNDSEESVKEIVDISLVVGGEEHQLLSWTGSADELSSRRGPTVRMILPDVSDDRIVLKLSSGEYSSEYTLKYYPRVKKEIGPKILNV